MSDSSENQIIQQDEDEYVPEIDNTNYFKEQDEKFEELHKKLQKLKEENKKQIDAIINSLDDLMANKCIIEQTLDKVGPEDLAIEISNENLSIVDLLSKVTGIVKESNINSSKDCNVDSALQVGKEHESQRSDQMDCTDSTPKDSELSTKKEETTLLNSKDDALQISTEDKSQTLDKIDCTDKTPKDSKTTEDSPLVNSRD